MKVAKFSEKQCTVLNCDIYLCVLDKDKTEIIMINYILQFGCPEGDREASDILKKEWGHLKY